MSQAFWGMPVELHWVDQGPDLQTAFHDGWIRILGAKGISMGGFTTHHFEEGPSFAYLNMYRLLAENELLAQPRDEEPSSFTNDETSATMTWDHLGGAGRLAIRYQIIPDSLAIDAHISVEPARSYRNFEVFVANYFTPYHTPRYAVTDTQVTPDPITFYEKQWDGSAENSAWPRDEQARAIFRDGRWTQGHTINWRLGPDYALPVMTQYHRYGPAVITMGREPDCVGISGLFSYHNSQYVHLFGTDVDAGDHLATDLRMVLVPDVSADELTDRAVEEYRQWTAGDQ